MGFRNRVLTAIDEVESSTARLRAAMSLPEPDSQEAWYALMAILEGVQYSMTELLTDGWPTGPKHERRHCYHCGGHLERKGPRDCPACGHR
jgi:hypothetical protein